jgi:hypothetical protein
MSSLLWELSEYGVDLVDRSRLQATFTPLIAASKEKRDEVMQLYRARISKVYGESADQAFAEVSDLDIPVALQSYYAQQAEELAEKLEEEQKRRVQAQAQGRLSQKERDELDRLRMEKKQRERRARAKRQAGADRKGKGKRNT